MGQFGYSHPTLAERFALSNRIDLMEDHRELGTVLARLALLNRDGSTVEHITETGADYEFTEIDLFDAGNVLTASRMVGYIRAGKRTELAYWMPAAPAKRLSIHQGVGNLVISYPVINQTDIFKLDAAVTPGVRLPSGVFYALEADEETPFPLVVSGLYEPGIDWDALEMTIRPGQDSISVAEGTMRVTVPADFRNRYS